MKPFRSLHKQCSRIVAALALLALTFAPNHAQVFKQPNPGDVYREYAVAIDLSGDAWHVTNAQAVVNYPGYPASGAGPYPNPVNHITIGAGGLVGAVRAEAILTVWGGHVGTTNKQIRFNSNSFISIPELQTTPTSGQCYIQQANLGIDVPIAHLREGDNTFQAESGTQSCYSFNWGQWGLYGVLIRVYYDPASKAHVTGSVTSPATNAIFGDNPTVSASVTGSADRVDLLGYYDGYDTDGDGVYLEYHGDYNMPKYGAMAIRNHVGTATNSPWSVTWDNSVVPDQSGMKMVARIRGTDGVWYVTQPSTNLTLQRSGATVVLYKAYNVGEREWAKGDVDDGVHGYSYQIQNVNIPSTTNASTATALIRTWHGVDTEDPAHYVQFNGYTFPALGDSYFAKMDALNVPTSSLVNGGNAFTFYSPIVGHHGIEILWPGPGLVVRFTGSGGPVAPSITQQPANQTVTLGQTATVTVAASGTAPLSYQWQKNNVNIGGATGSSYTTPATVIGDNGSTYRCVVTNSVNSATSTAATLTVNSTPPPSGWWNGAWRYRVPVNVDPAGYERTTRPVDVSLNFTQLLAILGASGTFNESSLRVIEVTSSGSVIDSTLAFQFDKDPAYNAASNASGTLVFMLNGTTATGTARYFHVYFDTASGFTAPSFANLVTVTDNVIDEGQSSFLVATQGASYYYQKQGAGFSSILDPNGNDWLNYHVGGGSAGEYRGLPNMGAWAHPGYTNSTSSLSSSGPLKATVASQTTDGAWKLIWEFYPRFARMTLKQAGGTYWLLYEGTPGGTYDPATGFWVRSSGERLNDDGFFAGDIAGPEWVYFGDRAISRFLFLAHHEDDNLEDQYWNMQNNMTVFGFGRENATTTPLMTAAPAHLTIGFGEDTLQAVTTINGAYRDLALTVGTPQSNPVHVRLKVFLQGPFNTGTGAMNTSLNTSGQLTTHFGAGTYPATAVDSINIEIRDAVTAAGSTIRRFGPAWLLSDGTLRSFADTAITHVAWDLVAEGSYYIVVRHRNHLPIMSASAVALSAASTVYDFTTSQSSAYSGGADGLKAVGTKFAMFAGNGDGDGSINATDRNAVWRVQNGFINGYHNGDFNLDANVNATDRNGFWRLNNGTLSQVP